MISESIWIWIFQIGIPECHLFQKGRRRNILIITKIFESIIALIEYFFLLNLLTKCFEIHMINVLNPKSFEYHKIKFEHLIRKKTHQIVKNQSHIIEEWWYIIFIYSSRNNWKYKHTWHQWSFSFFPWIYNHGTQQHPMSSQYHDLKEKNTQSRDDMAPISFAWYVQSTTAKLNLNEWQVSTFFSGKKGQWNWIFVDTSWKIISMYLYDNGTNAMYETP